MRLMLPLPSHTVVLLLRAKVTEGVTDEPMLRLRLDVVPLLPLDEQVYVALTVTDTAEFQEAWIWL